LKTNETKTRKQATPTREQAERE